PPVHTHAHEARAADLVPHRLVLFLSFALDRRQYVQLAALRQAKQFVDDFVGGLRADGGAARRTMRVAQPREQDAEVIVDFRNRAHRRARALARRLLFDADRRRQAADVLDLRLLNLAEELPGVGRQRFDIAPLPFRVNRIERERAFAGTARPAEDR